LSLKKKKIATLVISITLVSIIFSPFPGIDAVSIILSNVDVNAGTGNTGINVDILVRDPSAVTFPNGLTEETLSNSVVKVTIDPGTFNQKTALFDLSGNVLSLDTSGVINSLTLNAVVKTGFGQYGNLGYGYGYGYGYGVFYGYGASFGSLYGIPYGYGTTNGILGDGTYGYGLTSNAFDMDTTGKYTIDLAPGLLSVGSHTIRVDVLQNTNSQEFFTSGNISFENGEAIPPTFDSAETGGASNEKNQVRLTFSEALAASSVGTDDFEIFPIASPNVISVSVSGSVVTLTFDEDLADDAEPTIILKNGKTVTDLLGNALTGVSNTIFQIATDGIPPEIVKVETGPGADKKDEMLVTLSEAVDGANEPTNPSWSITGGTNTNGVSIDSVTATDGENTAVLNLSGDLAAGDSLEVTYTPGDTIVDSTNGNPLEGDSVTADDLIPPEIVKIETGPGTSKKAEMLVTFTEPVDDANEATNPSWSITGGTNTNSVTIDSVTATDGTNTAILNLSGNLATGDEPAVTYTPGATIVDSNNANVLAGDVVTADDLIPPEIVKIETGPGTANKNQMLVTLTENVDGANEGTNPSWSFTGLGTNTNGVTIDSVTASDNSNTAVLNLSGDLATGDEPEVKYTIGTTIEDSNNSNDLATSTVTADDLIPPELSAVSISSDNTNSDWAKDSDQIIIDFTTTETIQQPTVKVTGTSGDITFTVGQVNSGDDIVWQASGRTFSDTEMTDGDVGFTIEFADDSPAGNVGVDVTAVLPPDSSEVTWDETAPTVTLQFVKDGSGATIPEDGTTLKHHLEATSNAGAVGEYSTLATDNFGVTDYDCTLPLGTSLVAVAQSNSVAASEISHDGLDSRTSVPLNNGGETFDFDGTGGTAFTSEDHQVDCEATDPAGNTSTNPSMISFILRVEDTTPPEVNLPTSIDAKTLIDLFEDPATQSVNPAFDDATPIPEDSAGSKSFTVEVTGFDGTPLTYVATATDDVGIADTTFECTTVDDVVAAVSTPTIDLPSTLATIDTDVLVGPQTFPIGPAFPQVTTVTCQAIDLAGLSTSDSFTVQVEDNVLPTIFPPVTVATKTLIDLFEDAATQSVSPQFNPATATPEDSTRSQSFTVEVTEFEGTPINYVAKAFDLGGVSDTTFTCTPDDVLVAAVSSTDTPAESSTIDTAALLGDTQTFPIGPAFPQVTTVDCQANDRSTNTNSSAFTVQVEDNVLPTIFPPVTVATKTLIDLFEDAATQSVSPQFNTLPTPEDSTRSQSFTVEVTEFEGTPAGYLAKAFDLGGISATATFECSSDTGVVTVAYTGTDAEGVEIDTNTFGELSYENFDAVAPTFAGNIINVYT